MSLVGQFGKVHGSMMPTARQFGIIRWTILALLILAVVLVPFQKHFTAPFNDSLVASMSLSDTEPSRGGDGGCGPGSVCVACALLKQLHIPSTVAVVRVELPRQMMARVGNSSVPRSTIIRDHFRPPISALV